MTQRQLEDVVWMATVMALGLNPASDATQSAVRISWPLTEENSPNWLRTENVVFIRFEPYSDDYSALWETSHADSNDGFKEAVSNHESYEVLWLCYGPDSLEQAQKLRYGLGREDIRAYLNALSVAFWPHIQMPTHVPEQDRTGAWWERYDVRAPMYCKQVRQYSEGYIDTTPNITINTSGGRLLIYRDESDGELVPNAELALNCTDFDGYIVIEHNGNKRAIKVHFTDMGNGEIVVSIIP